MIESVKIESRNNQRIKNLIKLNKRSERSKTGLFIVEGILELERAILSDYDFDSVFFCPSIVDEEKAAKLFSKIRAHGFFEVTEEVFAKIAYRESTGGVVATAYSRKHTFDDLSLPENPLVLVLEAIEKPGNIGAIYRSADAAGVDAVIICEPRADIYNPNAVRASIGTVFSVPTVLTNSEEAVNFLKNNKIRIFSSYLKAAKVYTEADFRGPAAIVMGTEATGISQVWIDNADENIIIPMRGIADSLNVSTATAVLLFEASRQREEEK